MGTRLPDVNECLPVEMGGRDELETIIENLLDDRGDVINDLSFQGQRESLPKGTRCWWHDASHS
jgi:hypothetical protein